MALTNFVDKVTVVTADWLNKVDVLKETVFDGAQGKLAAILGLFSGNEKFLVNPVSAVSGTNTILGTFALTIRPGQLAYLTPAVTNTGATTLNAVPVQNIDGTACIGGELVAAVPAALLLNAGSTAWIIVNPNVLKSRGMEAGVRYKTFQSGIVASVAVSQSDDRTVLLYQGVGGHTFTFPSSGIIPGSTFEITNAGTGAISILVAGGGILAFLNGSGALGSGTRTLAVAGNAIIQYINAGTNLTIKGPGLT